MTVLVAPLLGAPALPGDIMTDQPSVEPVPDSKLQLPQVLPHAAENVYPVQAQLLFVQVRLAPHLFPQLPQLLLSWVAFTHVLQHLPVVHWISLLQAVVVLEILLVHWLLLVLQYWFERQLFDVAVPQLPVPSQLEDITADQSVLQVLGQAVADPGYTQAVCVPSQYFVPQVPLPVQPVRAVVVALHCPGVALHDWHSPSHLSLQQ